MEEVLTGASPVERVTPPQGAPELRTARLAREDLVRRLLQVPSGGLGLIVAPLGYGGSTLLDLVAEASSEVVVRVNMGRAQISGGLPSQLEAALSNAGVSGLALNAIERLGVDEVGGGLPDQPAVLVLVDDVEHPENVTLDREFTELLERTPHSVRVIARVRRAPGLDFSHLLARGRLVLLTREDLTLSAKESERYIALTAPGLAPTRRSVLAEIGEGWIGALTAAIFGSGNEIGVDPAEWLMETGLDLLVGPMVGQLSAADRDLLIRTSVVERLTPEVCDAVMGISGSASQLSSLRAAQVIAPVSGVRRTEYRRHGLLREWLSRRLAELGLGHELAAHRAAGDWFAEHGEIESAIAHLLEVGDVSGVSQILAERVQTLLESGEADRVLGWYRQAPELAVAANDLHLLAAAWSEVLAGQVTPAGDHLLALEARVELLVGDASGGRHRSGGKGEGAEWLGAEAALLRAYLEAWAGRLGSALRQVRRARGIYDEAWDRTAHQMSAVLEARLRLWIGEVETAAEIITSTASRTGTRRYYRRVEIPALAAQIAVREGRVHRAQRLAQQAIDELESVGWLGRVDDLDARLARSASLLDLGDVADAIKDADYIASHGAEVGHVTFQVLGGALLARGLAASGDAASAEAVFVRTRICLHEHAAGPELALFLESAAVEIAIDSGDRRRVRDALERVSGRVDPFVVIRAAGMGGRIDEAEVVRLVRANRPVTPRQVVDVRLLMASAQAPSRPQEAALHLSTAAEIAAEHGMLRALCGRSDEVLALAERICAEKESPGLSSLLDLACRPSVALTPVRRLSLGERDLLGRLKGASGNRELAEDMGISVNTLKTRLRRLYAKLDVHDRAEAASLASHVLRRPED